MILVLGLNLLVDMAIGVDEPPSTDIHVIGGEGGDVIGGEGGDVIGPEGPPS